MGLLPQPRRIALPYGLANPRQGGGLGMKDFAIEAIKQGGLDARGPAWSRGVQDRGYQDGHSRPGPGAGTERPYGVRKAAHAPPRHDRTRPADLVRDLRRRCKEIGQLIILHPTSRS